MRKKQEDNLKLREELHKANIELEHYKMLQKEEEKIAEMRVQEFMRKKAEREQAREEEQKAIREAKEKEIARLRSQQEKAADQQAMFEEMNARRVQEEVERAWRIKEIEQARKKKEELRQLHLAREKQIEDIRRAQAIELARDEQEFHQVQTQRMPEWNTMWCIMSTFRWLKSKLNNTNRKWRSGRKRRNKQCALGRNC